MHITELLKNFDLEWNYRSVRLPFRLLAAAWRIDWKSVKLEGDEYNNCELMTVRTRTGDRVTQ